MKKGIMAGLFSILITASGCSTYGMNSHLEEEQTINTDKYAYDDENFVYNKESLQELADRFRIEDLTTANINSIMEEEIENGRYNEIIIYLRELQAEEPEQAASFSDRYIEALQSHVEHTEEPAQPLVQDAVDILQSQYESQPDNEENIINYATLLIESEYDTEQGTTLLFDLEEDLQENGEDPGRDLLLALAQAYSIAGDYEKSLDRYDTLTTLDSEDPTHFYRMSQVYAEMNDEEGEREALTQAFEPTSDFLDDYGDDSYNLYKDYLHDSIENEDES
ncbi:hypothetical protein D7Z54_10025 [Salibacterium salarium]|uniref:Uncharacterized protein n=1 Tax=Salibacterium salarium TaxID=284579 RepID=A0A3R9P9W2_9BACI|nr:hypothetical protein [Salibacterium salarium]RSL33637.1 hypothetical protein D7Z54_10025 [Salibacterium salarium]